jgi:hypothetical protein
MVKEISITCDLCSYFKRCDRAIVGKSHCFAWEVTNIDVHIIDQISIQGERVLEALNYCIAVMEKMGISTKHARKLAKIGDK